VHVELPMQATIVFVVGLGESPVALRRLAGDVDEVVMRLRTEGATPALVPPAASLGYEVAVPPRDAFLGEAELVAVDDAVGRISCESIASYPPGVPALLPGERISAATIAYLRELAASGARLHGASDPEFQTINVLVEPA
jgi:arginine/lysine/ornithine decarboxylase